MTLTELFVVVPAGGSGTRLWPLSRASNPKFLHALTGTDRSLLQATFDRLTPLAPPERLLVVTGTAHAAGVARQLPDLPDSNILVEPFARDSCAAIALAAAVIERRSPGAVMASFAADHLITDTDEFARTVERAVAGAREGYLMTIGITPTRPETGYGYLRLSAQAERGVIQPVLEFKEKPSLEVASRYVSSGSYLWNASMFVWRTDLFLAELAARRPDVAGPIAAIAAAWDTDEQEDVLAELWPTVPKVAVEYAVMEPAAEEGKVATVPGDFGWSDIGDFETVVRLLGTDVGQGGRSFSPATRSRAVVVDGEDVIVVPNSGRLVATLGVRDLIVVDTDDAVLVCDRDRAQDIKRLTEILREHGEADYL
ncbi:mannose-1-phosphate guanylyltransferase [Actinokineospora globicatena]|uniref:Mannose-1-phosphate guanyltransferase n=1 Tax=Actinokineospora globicatena TaxID=103729 RepID=A0A9W6VDU5_9PSEU|nr:mannose-1-phosphate guanylyltransferase [Actinokineospora globicatena]MCP2302095.1 mannose-1-phosphate guanylyltransferase [Actinokineospora globicatena]GLW76243.1 mannose-1-phosphate guanyltransferase [Actinokineospora globicatena]GLW83079.1 mannose-1-phosphate guanyltransferase [Actinokineospora globicatena]GLW95358.1 mannose-1-phosphate guanyltransferase [Actinokineospora globicatena]